MPYNIRKIDSRVREERKALGVRFPFSTEDISEKSVGKPGASEPYTFNRYGVFTSTYQTADVIKSNLMNYFMTAKGERYLNPTFGNDILNLMFENLSEELKQATLSQTRLDLSNYFPEIDVNVLELIDLEDNSVQLHMEYSIKYSGNSDSLDIKFN